MSDKIANLVFVEPWGNMGGVHLCVIGEATHLLPTEVDALIRALAAARVEISKEPPK